MSTPQQPPDPDAAYSALLTFLGSVTPAELQKHLGRHVQAVALGEGVAGHLERIEGDHAVIINGWGTNRVPISGRRWVLHPGRFTLGGKPVGSTPQGGSDPADDAGRSSERALPDVTAEESDAAEQERLVRLAEDLELGELAVGDLVYDMLHRGAADTYNNGAYEELDDIEALEAVHDDADEKASDINNQGLEAQIGALVAAWGPADVERALREEADE